MSTETGRPRRSWTLHFGGGPDWSGTQLALAGAQVLAVVLFLVAMDIATGGFDIIFWALALVPVVTMSWSGSGAPLMLWGLLVLAWFYLSPTGAFSWWSLLGAAALLLGHTATALASTAPPAGTFAAETVARWAGQAAIALAAAVPVALLVALVRGADLGLGPVSFVVGLLGIAVGLWLVRSNPPAARD